MLCPTRGTVGVSNLGNREQCSLIPESTDPCSSRQEWSQCAALRHAPGAPKIASDLHPTDWKCSLHQSDESRLFGTPRRDFILSRAKAAFVSALLGRASFCAVFLCPALLFNHHSAALTFPNRRPALPVFLLGCKPPSWANDVRYPPALAPSTPAPCFLLPGHTAMA